VLFFVASGKPGFELGGFAANGFAENSPGGYPMEVCLVAELVLTFMFLMIILGATDRRAPQGFAQHRTGGGRGWMGTAAVVAVLGRSHGGSGDCRIRLPVACGP
jgi:glycerol uptake facilitator-like aquaporin